MGKPIVKESGTPAEGTMQPSDSGTQSATTQGTQSTTAAESAEESPRE